MRWIIVGADGMLGKDLALKLSDHDVISFTKFDCDITDSIQVKKRIKDAEVVVNCAAYTAVDAAEENFYQANLINGQGPQNLANVCKSIGAKLVQISTDYVFPGDAKKPYEVNDLTGPKSAYGKSKLLGEIAVSQILNNQHYIVRTAWLYGKHGQSFPKTMLKLAKTNQHIDVVNDQLGQPTWTVDLADKIVELVEKAVPSGTYHCSSSGQTTWFEFAQKTMELAGLDKGRIKPVTSKFFQRPAPRPSYSVLSHANLTQVGIAPIQGWEQALKKAFESGVFVD